MSANLTKWWPSVPDSPTPEQTALHTRQIFNGLNDHDQAITTLKQQLTAATFAMAAAATEESSSTTAGVTSFNTLAGNVTYFPYLGHVNDQLGNPAYTTQATDNGAKIIVGDSSVVAVTLNAGVGTPWFTIIDNDSSSYATLTPSAGTLFGAQRIPPRAFGVVYFDGIFFWCGAAPPIGIDSTVTTAPLTMGGTEGSMTFIAGSCVSSIQAT